TVTPGPTGGATWGPTAACPPSSRRCTASSSRYCCASRRWGRSSSRALKRDANREGARAIQPSEPMNLYIIRHADAGNPKQWRGDDADRPLSELGRRQARALGEAFRHQQLPLDVVVSSPTVRTR